MDKSITDAVRSLQFEDIVRQLTVSSEKHLDYLERVLGTVDEGIRSLNSQHINVPEYIVGLHELKSQIDQLEAECKAEADRSVSQKTMQEGDIELF
jgi:methyl-accepting chemotaxis protein